MALRSIELFAGAGGLALGLESVGVRTVCFVEREAYAAAVLAARMAEGRLAPAPVWGDVCTFDGRRWRGVVDLVAGGFPCQDISHAGKGAGIVNGERSGLWREFARIVGEVGPRYVFVENVSALRSRGLDVVLRDLAALGFHAEWDTFRASDVGAPHRRERIFILAVDNAAGGTSLDVCGGRRDADAQRSNISDDSQRSGDVADVGGANERRGSARAGRRSAGASGAGGSDDVAHARRERDERRGEPEDVESATGAAETDGEQRERSGCTAGDCGPGGMEHAPVERRGEGRAGGVLDWGWDAADYAGGILADTSAPGLEVAQRSTLQRAGRRGEGGATRQLRGTQVADPDERGREGERVGRLLDGERSAWRDNADGSRGLAPWPPGPQDAKGWRAYLKRWPGTEPALCRGADGMAAGTYGGVQTRESEVACLCNRVDRLRALGNGVIPQQAALAWRVLWDRLHGE